MRKTIKQTGITALFLIGMVTIGFGQNPLEVTLTSNNFSLQGFADILVNGVKVGEGAVYRLQPTSANPNPNTEVILRAGGQQGLIVVGNLKPAEAALAHLKLAVESADQLSAALTTHRQLQTPRNQTQIPGVKRFDVGSRRSTATGGFTITTVEARVRIPNAIGEVSQSFISTSEANRPFTIDYGDGRPDAVSYNSVHPTVLDLGYTVLGIGSGSVKLGAFNGFDAEGGIPQLIDFFLGIAGKDVITGIWDVTKLAYGEISASPAELITVVNQKKAQAVSVLNGRFEAKVYEVFGEGNLFTGIEYNTNPESTINIKSGQGGKSTTKANNSPLAFGTGAEWPDIVDSDELRYAISDEENITLWGEPVKYEGSNKIEYNGEDYSRANFLISALIFNSNELTEANVSFEQLDILSYTRASIGATDALFRGESVGVNFNNNNVNVNQRFAPASTPFTFTNAVTINTNYDFSSSLNGITNLNFNNSLNFNGSFFNSPINFLNQRGAAEPVDTAAVYTPFTKVVTAQQLQDDGSLPEAFTENKKAFDKLFRQALVIPQQEQRFSLTSATPAVDQAELYHVLYQASRTAKEQLHAFLNNPALDEDAITDEWVTYLRRRDPVLYQRIVAKVAEFKQSQNSGAHALFPVPVYKVELVVEPAVETVNPGTDTVGVNFRHLRYQVRTSLKDAVIRLGVAQDCDSEVTLGVVLSPEELTFLQSSWGEDTDEDGRVDKGFVLALQRRLRNFELILSVKLHEGGHPSYRALNQAVKAMASAQLVKDRLRQGEWSALDDAYRPLVDSRHLAKHQLLATTPVTYHSDVPENKSMVMAESDLDGVTDLPVLTSDVAIMPLQQTAGKDEASENARASSNYSARLSFSLAESGYVSKDPKLLAAGRSHLGTLSIKNISGSVKRNKTFRITVSNDREVSRFNVFVHRIGELKPGEEKVFYFRYIPQTLGKLKFRVREGTRAGGLSTFERQEVNVVRNIADVINRNALCQLPEVYSGIVANGKTVRVAGSLVASAAKVNHGGTFQVRATERVSFKPGFHAKAGSAFRAAITSCSTVRNIKLNSLD